MESSSKAPLPSADSIKLIISDVDGTLLTDDHQVHPRTKAAILYIREKRPEVQVAIATGKQRNSCQWFIDELGFDHFPAAGCHGGVIHGPHGQVLDVVGVGNSNAVRIADEAKSLDLTCFLFTVDGVHLVHAETKSGTDWVGLASKYDKNVVNDVDTNFLQLVASEQIVIVKATVLTSAKRAPSQMTHFASILPPTVRVTRALPFIIEIVPKGVDKGFVLRHFCDLLKCRPDEVVAFGDGENDVEMLRATPHGVAMGNAMPAAIEAATHRTLTNNEGGVGAFLDRIFRPGHAPVESRL